MVRNIFKARSKWLTPLLPYLAVGLGVFWFQDAWAALFGFHFAILLCLLLAKPRLPVSLLLESNRLGWVILSLALSGSAGIFLYFFWSAFEITGNLAVRVNALGLNTSNWMAFIVYFTLVNPFVEEYFWRGYLGSPTKRLHISDFIYAGFHALVLAGSMPAASILYSLSALVLAGWFWRQLAREDGGLLAPVLGHMAADFTILLVICRMAL